MDDVRLNSNAAAAQVCILVVSMNIGRLKILHSALMPGFCRDASQYYGGDRGG